MPGETNLSPITGQVYDEGAGIATPEVKNATMTPADRLRVDIAAGPLAPVSVVGKADEIIVEVENTGVTTGNILPVAPPEFGPKVWNVDSSIKYFSVSATVIGGSGRVIIEYRVDADAWENYETIYLAVNQSMDKIFVPTRGRYQVYFLADEDSIIDLNVILHPQT